MPIIQYTKGCFRTLVSMESEPHGRLAGWGFGLRSRGIWLVLVAAIPAVLVVVFSSLDRRDQDSKNILRQQAQLEAGVKTNYERQFANAQNALAPLSVIFGLVSQTDLSAAKSPACDSFMSDMLRSNPGYLNLILAGPTGEVICSARPVAELDFAKRSFFQSALLNKTMSVSGFRSDDTNRWIDLAVPVSNSGGATFAIVVATLDLKSFDAIGGSLQLPNRSTIEITNRSGVILSSWPNPDSNAGQTDPKAPLDPAADGSDETGKERSDSGEKQLYATSYLRTPDGTVVARLKMTTPESVAFSAANNALRRDLVLLAGAGILTLMGAWWLSGRFLLQPMVKLMAATERIADGDLGARVGPNYASSEFGVLGRTFDRMARTVEEQTVRIRQANRDFPAQWDPKLGIHVT